MNPSFILLADAETWIKIVGGVIVMLIYLVNHVVGAAGKAQQRRQMRPDLRPDPRAARPRPAVPSGRPGAHDAAPHDAGSPDDVAEFLRRAAEKRAAAKLAQTRRTQQAEIVEARTVEELPSSHWPSPMQPQVNNPNLSQRGERLSHVDREEAAFQDRMQAFEHRVGRIHESPANPPAPPSDDQTDAGPQTYSAPPNEVFAALLSDPQSLRQAIILNEIIERPVGRW